MDKQEPEKHILFLEVPVIFKVIPTVPPEEFSLEF